MNNPTVHSTSGEEGLGGVEVLPIGVLVLTIVTMVVMGAWNVIDAKFAATAAAREGARTAVETFDLDKARSAATLAWTQHGRPTPINVDIAGSMQRCSRVTVRTSVDVESIPIPVLKRWSTTTVRSTHSEVVDPFRAGLPGEARC